MIRALERGHYWLMCGAGPDGSGRWNFRLESFDGQVRIDAEDEEPGAHADHLALLALVLGLEAIDQPADVLVLTPNRYIWQGLSEGLDEWRENGWQWDSFGGLVPIKYLDLWQRVERLRNIHDVSCRAIPSAQIACRMSRSSWSNRVSPGEFAEFTCQARATGHRPRRDVASPPAGSVRSCEASNVLSIGRGAKKSASGDASYRYIAGLVLRKAPRLANRNHSQSLHRQRGGITCAPVSVWIPWDVCCQVRPRIRSTCWDRTRSTIEAARRWRCARSSPNRRKPG